MHEVGKLSKKKRKVGNFYEIGMNDVGNFELKLTVEVGKFSIKNFKDATQLSNSSETFRVEIFQLRSAFSNLNEASQLQTFQVKNFHFLVPSNFPIQDPYHYYNYPCLVNFVMSLTKNGYFGMK